MMKEIHEQPKSQSRDTVELASSKTEVIDLSDVGLTDEDDQKMWDRIYIVACGSAYHVGMAAQYVLEDHGQNSGARRAGI